WYTQKQRERQLDDHIDQTGKTNFGLVQLRSEEKKMEVLAHFNRVAPKYDFMNSFLSFGIQHVWKRKAVRMLDLKPGQKVLDVCGGTGDLSILAARKAGPSGRVVLYDINRAMINAGRQKINSSGVKSRIKSIQGDAEELPFSDDRFDAAMVGFGIRNVTHMKKGFIEMHRVLKPDGKIMCLDFSKPTNRLFCFLYDFYSFNIMPFLGEMILGSGTPYARLSESIRMFLLPHEISALLEEIGFKRIRRRNMTNGIASVHVGVK
ncbi:bifunctional demethylmenaquinone methyltransferase/2-methoxy-6-polyprenyl-1,4-benzoquinol methylase UbiE, partial [Thermodesulfobacteriota bacterium]